MAELGGCVDELELDLLQGTPGCLREQALPQCDAPLAAAWDLALFMHQQISLKSEYGVELLATVHWRGSLVKDQQMSPGVNML